MRTRPLILTLSLASALLSSRALSQNDPAPVPTVTTEETPAVMPEADVEVTPTPAEPEVIIKGAEPTESTATKGKSSSGADTLSVDFPDEDLRNILRNVADLFELNVVIPDTLQGRTSIKLRDVTWRQIFQVVLAPVGFTYVEDGNIIKVLSVQNLQQEPVSTEVFILNYARAADIKPTLDSLIDGAAGGKIVIDSRSNALVITERPSQMNKIRPIIEQLDKATDQVMIESKFVEVTNADIKNIGVNWSSLAGMELGVSGISQEFTKETGQQHENNGRVTSEVQNDVTYVDIPTNLDTTRGGFGTSTINLPDGTITDQTASVAGTTAVANFSSDPAAGTITYTAPHTYSSAEIASGLSNLVNTGSTSRMASAVFSASDFNIIISALKQQNDTKLVSNPTIVTLNNSEAVINIGKEYPIPNYTYNQERGVYEVSGFNYRPIGIILKVTPQVNARGFIKLTLEPEVSSSAESASFGAAEIPIITTRKTKTQVSLKDGYTMGIGGLIEQSLTTGQTKVPVLGSIPLLGRLFRSDSKNDQRRNLIIFITAKTVPADGAPITEVFDSRSVRQMQLKRSDLPGYRDGSDPFLPEVPVTEEKK